MLKFGCVGLVISVRKYHGRLDDFLDVTFLPAQTTWTRNYPQVTAHTRAFAFQPAWDAFDSKMHLYFNLPLCMKNAVTYNCELSLEGNGALRFQMIKLKMCVSEPRKCSVHSCQSIHECVPFCPKILKKIFHYSIEINFTKWTDVNM